MRCVGNRGDHALGERKTLMGTTTVHGGGTTIVEFVGGTD